MERLNNKAIERASSTAGPQPTDITSDFTSIPRTSQLKTGHPALPETPSCKRPKFLTSYLREPRDATQPGSCRRPAPATLSTPRIRMLAHGSHFFPVFDLFMHHQSEPKGIGYHPGGFFHSASPFDHDGTVTQQPAE